MIQTESHSTSAVLAFPVRILLLLSSRSGSIEQELRRTLNNSVITKIRPGRVMFMKDILGRHDVLISDLRSYETLGEELNKGIAGTHIPFLMLISPHEEIKVLDEICPGGLLWDFVLKNDLRKIPFVINRYFENIGEEINSEEVTEILYQYRIKKLTDQNLQLMDQLSEKENTIHEMLHDEHKFKRMVEESGDVVYTTNYKGEFTYLNPRVAFLTGYSIDEMLGHHFLELIHPDQQNEIEAFYRRQFEERISETVKDFTIVTKQGEVKWVEQTVKLLADGNFVKGFQCIVRDVNERKRYEQKLAKHAALLEKTNKELETFAYVASHDLKEPLRKITTFSSRVQALPEMQSISDKGRDYLARLNAATKRMEGMIEDLLAYSRITRTKEKMSSCDLNVVLDEVVTELEPEIAAANARIESEDLPVICVIQTQVKNVFRNLLSNALKFTKEEGTPEIQVKATVVPAHEVPCKEVKGESEFVKLCVIDNGIGFDNKYCDRIFEIFQRLHGKTEYPGTGIGLAIVKKIAERHGGCVMAIGKPGVGSEFHIFFPVIRDPETQIYDTQD